MKIQFMLIAVLLLSTASISLAQKSFKKISIQGSMNVTIDQSTDKLTVKALEGEFMITEDGSTITLMNGVGDGKAVTIATDQLEEIEVGGSVEVKEISELKFNKIKLVFEGSCDAPIRLDCTTAKLELGGTTDLVLTGKATTVDFKVSGSNEIDAKGFIVDHASINVMGSNNSWINAKKTLKIKATGACNISYKSYLVATKPKKKYLPAVSKKLIGSCVVKAY
jgi:hypothetical protein